MNSFNVISKQILGARYESVRKSLLACLIIFCAVYVAEIRVTVAPVILFLTATLFSLGVMWRSLGSARNAETMMGLFMLPFNNKQLVGAYLLAFGSYTIITKTLLVLTFFFAVNKWSIAQILMAVLCACNGCALAAVWYVMLAKKNLVPVILWGCGTILSNFLIKQLAVFCGIIAISLVAAIQYLLSVDAYMFYRPVSAGKLIKRAGGKGSVLLYLSRYLTTNKSYLMNTAGLWVIACYLPLLLEQFDGLNAMPLGFAILSLNTPIGVLLSCDRELEQAVRALPGQAVRFGSRYCLFIFIVNIITDSIYLISWYLLYYIGNSYVHARVCIANLAIERSSIFYMDVVTAVLFALQIAILSIILEWRYPIRNWKIENDLWHHPRKYIVPILMMLIAVFVGTKPTVVWFWLYIVLAECFGLFLIASIGGFNNEKRKTLSKM